MGLFCLSGKQWPAHRVAWVIDHEQSLTSWYRVSRTCKTKDCVRPAHLKVTRGTKPKGANGKPKVGLYILRLGNNKTIIQPRRRFTYDDLKKYVYDLKQLLAETVKLNVNSTQIIDGNLQLLEYIGHIDPPSTEIITKAVSLALDGRLGAMEARLDALSAHVEELRDTGTLNLALSPAIQAPIPALTAAVEPVPEPEPAPKPGPEPPTNGMREMLMDAFRAEMGGPDEPTDTDWEGLSLAFGLARTQSADTRAAVELFVSWIGKFRAVAEREGIDGSPEGFASHVATRSLD